MRHLPIRSRCSPRHGLTLIELLVVLAIMAAVASVAVRTANQTQQQGRYEATKRGMRELDEAVVGPPNLRSGDGSITTAGFVADVGRLPLVVGTDPATQAAELWSNPSSLPAYGLWPTSDPEISVEGGWRGPYLRLGIGSARLRDGWGNAYDLLKADGTAAAAGDVIAQVRSRGADNIVDAAPVNDYNADVLLSWTGNRAAATVTGQVQELDASDPALPVLRTPSGPVTVKIYWWDPTGVQERSFTTAAAGPCQYVFTGVPIGPRMIRAYLASPAKKSPPVRFAVLPAGSGPNLILQ